MNLLQITFLLLALALNAPSADSEKNYPTALHGCPIITISKRNQCVGLTFSDIKLPKEERRFNGDISYSHYPSKEAFEADKRGWRLITNKQTIIKYRDSLNNEIQYFYMKWPTERDASGDLILAGTCAYIAVSEGDDYYLLSFMKSGNAAEKMTVDDIKTTVHWLSGIAFSKLRPEDIVIPLPPK